ncbi:IS630 family transposase [Piscirickettsia salmonis]|uniref:IS630 family transposase n=1 Tax=Piscirickettsia salmonis TaxID=1238 RepID=UPI0012BAEDE0|nr:IS630 family transposase [Piscirickettsia salmonis]
MEKLTGIDLSQLVYLDEVGVDDNIVVEYGWSAAGVRSYAEQAGFKRKRLSLVAGLKYSDKSLVAPFEFSGAMNKDLFLGWFEQELCPKLNPGQVIIMDNASFHKSPELYDMVEAVDCELLYLPAYSPDLNPIEKFWANFKRNIRKVIKKHEHLCNAITDALIKTLPG